MEIEKFTLAIPNILETCHDHSYEEPKQLAAHSINYLRIMHQAYSWR